MQLAIIYKAMTSKISQKLSTVTLELSCHQLLQWYETPTNQAIHKPEVHISSKNYDFGRQNILGNQML